MHSLGFALLLLLTSCSSGDDVSSASHQVEAIVGTPVCPDGECETVVGVPVGVSPADEVRQPGAEVPCNGEDEDLDGKDSCGGDSDLDGVPAPIDCNDSDPAIGQRADEILCDGIDQNCDGIDDCDVDGDGVVDRLDCAPNDAKTNHCVDAAELPKPRE